MKISPQIYSPPNSLKNRIYQTKQKTSGIGLNLMYGENEPTSIIEIQIKRIPLSVRSKTYTLRPRARNAAACNERFRYITAGLPPF